MEPLEKSFSAFFNAKVTWNDNTEPDLDSYSVFVWDTDKAAPAVLRVSDDTTYYNLVELEKHSAIVRVNEISSTEFQWLNLNVDKTHKFGVAAYDLTGNYSDVSTVELTAEDLKPRPPSGISVEKILVSLGIMLLVAGLLIWKFKGK